MATESFVVDSEHEVVLHLAIAKKLPHQSSALEKCRLILDLAGHAALAGMSHTCTYTCSLTLIQKLTQNVFGCSNISTLQMLSSN